MDLTDKSEVVDDLLRTMERADAELGDAWNLNGEWPRTWETIPAAQRSAAAHETMLLALRSAHALCESASVAHTFKLDARSERLDASVRALCYLAALLRRLAQDADALDEVTR